LADTTADGVLTAEEKENLRIAREAGFTVDDETDQFNLFLAIGAFIIIAPSIGIKSAMDSIKAVKDDKDDRFK